jgi:hypothetical protein
MEEGQMRMENSQHQGSKQNLNKILVYPALGILLGVTLAVLGLEIEIKPPILSAAFFLLAGVIVAFRFLLGSRSFFSSPIYIAALAYVIFIGIGPLVEAFLGLDQEAAATSTWPLLASWIGFAALGLGSLLVNAAARSKRAGSGGPIAEDPEKTQSYFLYGGLAYSIVGLLGVGLYLHSVGGIGHLIQVQYGLRDNPSVYSGPYSLLRPGLYLLAAWAIAREKLPGWLLGCLLILAIWEILWFGPLRGSRNQILTIVLTLACLAKCCRVSEAGQAIVLVLRRRLLVVGLLMATVWGTLRHYSIAELGSMDASSLNVAQGTETASLQAFYATYEAFARIVELVPDSIPYLGGSSFYETLTVWVPRKLWPAKPYPLGDWLTENLYGFRLGGNTVPTWPGELYLDFGITGLVLGLMAMGMACAWLAQWLAAGGPARVSNSRRMLYASLFPLPFIWVWGGSNAAMWHCIGDVIPIYFVVLLARLSSRRAVYYGVPDHLTGTPRRASAIWNR